MRIVNEGLKSTYVLVSATIYGALAGLIGQFLTGIRCLVVDVPKVRPQVSVNLDFSNVNFSGVIKFGTPPEGASTYFPSNFPFYIDERQLQQNLAQTNVTVDIDVPNIEPQVNVESCYSPVYVAASVFAATSVLGLGIYHILNARKKAYSQDNAHAELEPIPLSELSDDSSEARSDSRIIRGRR